MRPFPTILEDVRIRLKFDWVGEPFQPGGQTAWVAPVHSRTFGDVVLKIAARHEEAIGRGQGAARLERRGAVRLFTAEDVERSHDGPADRALQARALACRQPPPIQDEVIADLLLKLWVQPPTTEAFRPLREMCELWASASERWAEERRAHVDVGLVRQGIELFRALAREPSQELLLCTDLHAENVLSAERDPWLMIDPKPYVGDPAYDVLQHIHQREPPVSIATPACWPIAWRALSTSTGSGSGCGCSRAALWVRRSGRICSTWHARSFRAEATDPPELTHRHPQLDGSAHHAALTAGGSAACLGRKVASSRAGQYLTNTSRNLAIPREEQENDACL